MTRAFPRSVRLLLLAAAAVIGLCQSEDEPYFSLSSSQTFGTDGKPSVSLGAFNVDSLAFRVYRIHDPVKFFTQLEDPHQFGGNVPRPPRDRTLLERLQSWKRALHAQIRRSLRARIQRTAQHAFREHPAQGIPAIRQGNALRGTGRLEFAATGAFFQQLGIEPIPMGARHGRHRRQG